MIYFTDYWYLVEFHIYITEDAYGSWYDIGSQALTKMKEETTPHVTQYNILLILNIS